MASGAMINAQELFEKYKKFVENNVETIGHLESAARILSYIVPGIVRLLSDIETRDKLPIGVW